MKYAQFGTKNWKRRSCLFLATIVIVSLSPAYAEFNEEQAQEILSDFGSNSLNIVNISNSDVQKSDRYMEEFFIANYDKFDPKILGNDVLYQYDPDRYLDLALTDAGLKDEYYDGLAQVWKDIFKIKLQFLDQYYLQSVQKIEALDMSEEKKMHYISELNNAKRNMENMVVTAVSTTLQPLEDQTGKSYSENLRSEITSSKNNNILQSIINTITSIITQIQSIFTNLQF